MLTSLNRIAGMPVIWQDRQIGCVELGHCGHIRPAAARAGHPKGHRHGALASGGKRPADRPPDAFWRVPSRSRCRTA